MTISEETQAKIQLWKKMNHRAPWYRWDGGWIESDGEATRYTNWGELGDEAVVFDVGAYEGEWTRRMASKYAYQFHAFEPAPRAFKVMQERLKDFKDVHLYNYGLGKASGTFPLSDYDRDGATFLPSKYGSIDAKKVNVLEFFTNEHIVQVALMSVNVEGDEFELFPVLFESGLVSVIARFMIQWHSPTTDSAFRMYEIQERLAETHKMLWNHGSWEAWGERLTSATFM